MSLMAFQPDILVTTPDGVALVIEAKVALPDLECTEQQLKHYMISMQCPTGVLITPERMWLYRDTFTSLVPESVRRVGEFDVKSLWPQPPPKQGAQFESFVQRLFEDLAKGPPKDVPDDLREPIREYILPAVISGEVRAAHPR